ncbi:hypothetical protein [Kitasatospora sp. NPDC004289]
MIKGFSAADGEPDAMVLAGYFVAVPASLNGSAVPRRPAAQPGVRRTRGAWASIRTDTEPVTWFPAALVEWDTPIEGRPGPAASEAPVPPVTPPWWRRIL